MWSHSVDHQFLSVCLCAVYMHRDIPYVSSPWLSVCLSVRSSHQLLVADPRPVGGLERAAAAGTQGGDQQETAGENQRKTMMVSLLFHSSFLPWLDYISSLVTFSMSASTSPHQSVWVRKGSLRWWRDWKPQRWVDVGVALEQSTKPDGRKDSIFFVYYTQYDEKKVGLVAHSHRRTRVTVQSQLSFVRRLHSHVLVSLSQYLHVFISEVTALIPVLRDCHYAFAVYTAQRTKQRWPLVLAAQTEKDMNDWVTVAQKHRKYYM